jgi:hypothetical protein
MDARQKRIAAARRNPNAVLLTYADAFSLAGAVECQVERLRRELEAARVRVVALQAALGASAAPKLGRSPNRMPKAACSGCGGPCTARAGKPRTCRACYRLKVKGAG